MKDIMLPTYVNTNSFRLIITTADFQQYNPYPAGDGNSEKINVKVLRYLPNGRENVTQVGTQET